MNGRHEPGSWGRDAEAVALRQLTGPDAAPGGFVVDGDGGGSPHVAACAVGRIEERLPAPGHPSGRCAFIFNVCTDSRYRGRGYARATTEALLDRFAERGVTRVDLHEADGAGPLYRSLGFAEHSTALSLDLRSRTPAGWPAAGTR